LPSWIDGWLSCSAVYREAPFINFVLKKTNQTMI
jgi:hypothetical protein